MKRLLFIFTMIAISVLSVSAQSDYYIKKAQSYQREAEYYQKKADGYRREAAYYLKKAEGYQREVILIVQRHTLVMLRMRWINTKHNCVMRLKQMTERQCI